MRLIDVDKLKELEPHYSEDCYRVFYEYEIDNAPIVDKLNVAINIIKDVCNTNSNCVDCPMNPNCNEFPTRWEEVKQNDG